MNTPRTKYPLAIFAGLTLVGSLAGCSAAADSSATDGADTVTSNAAETPAAEAPTTATGTTLADGTYTESGDYTSPNGTETIDVTITLANELITKVSVVGHGDNPNSKLYQSKFAGGISDVVVGKNIDDISVDKVAGSSLTSAGFMKAVDEIKADAAG